MDKYTYDIEIDAFSLKKRRIRIRLFNGNNRWNNHRFKRKSKSNRIGNIKRIRNIRNK